MIVVIVILWKSAGILLIFYMEIHAADVSSYHLFEIAGAGVGWERQQYNSPEPNEALVKIKIGFRFCPIPSREHQGAD